MTLADLSYLSLCSQTDFDTSRAHEFQTSTRAVADSASAIIAQTPKRSSGLSALLFGSGSAATKRPNSLYRKTRTPIPDGPACRVYGSVEVKKVTANLHITTLGHGQSLRHLESCTVKAAAEVQPPDLILLPGYMSREHTDHQRQSHV